MVRMSSTFFVGLSSRSPYSLQLLYLSMAFVLDLITRTLRFCCLVSLIVQRFSVYKALH